MEMLRNYEMRVRQLKRNRFKVKLIDSACKDTTVLFESEYKTIPSTHSLVMQYKERAGLL
jgi:hypothetical protein